MQTRAGQGSGGRPSAPGSRATTPWAIPAEGWKQVLLRTWSQTGKDNISLVAAGVAFYGFLAMVPMLGVMVLSYGLVAEPASVVHDMQQMTAVMPVDAAKLIGEQLMNVVHTSSGKKGIGLFVALAVALYGARNGAAAVVTALNIAYEEQEKRSFLRVTLLTLAITAGAVLVAIAAIVAIAALGHLEDIIPNAPGFVLAAGKLASYAMLVLVGAAGAATLYRYGPDRARAKWAWITPGSLGVALLWLLLTIAFGIYVADFGSYNATYGSLGAVVVFLTWLYLSSYVLLVGAELNSELERQTTRDTTTGPPKPIGERGATVADQAIGRPDAAPAAPSVSDAPGAGAPAEADPVPPLISRAVPLLGLGRSAIGPALLATAGLAALRREGRAGLGVALLGIGGAWSWLHRKPGS